MTSSARRTPRTPKTNPATVDSLIRDGRSAGDIVEERLRDLITKGDFSRHARLPPERELATQLGVSRMTLRQALAALERDGLVTRAAGRNGGTFIAQGKVERTLSRFVGVPEYLRSQGFTAGCRVLSAGVVPATVEVARALGIPRDTTVYDLVRVRLADGIAISLEHAHLPTAAFPGLLERALGGSISEIMRTHYKRVLARALEQIEAVLATPDEALTLGIRVGAPLMSIRRISVDDAGTPVEYSHDLFRGDRTRTVAWAHDDPTAAPLFG